MFKVVIKSLPLFFVLSFAVSAQAARSSSSGVVFTANAYLYNSTDEDTPGASTEFKSSVYDLKLGYLRGNGFYLGAIYSLRNTDQGNVKVDGNAVGASAGYVGASGIFVMGHYLAQAEWGTHKEGTGFQADLGFISNISGPLLLGVELTYRTIDYKKDEANAALESFKRSELMPMLTIGVVF